MTSCNCSKTPTYSSCLWIITGLFIDEIQMLVVWLGDHMGIAKSTLESLLG